MTNIDSIPQYYWYLTREHIPEYQKMYFFKGVTYVGFTDEPEPKTIDLYKLTFVGVGDMTMIGGR